MEDGINKFIGKMTHSHEITVAGTTLLHTGKLEPIDITVATRSGNKKVHSFLYKYFKVILINIKLMDEQLSFRNFVLMIIFKLFKLSGCNKFQKIGW